MSEKFPRLLVATEFAPNASGGGPAVLRQMLKDWPARNLFWWSCLPDNDKRFHQVVAAHRVARIPAKLYPHRRVRAVKSWLLERAWTPWAALHFRKSLELLKPEVVWVIPHNWAVAPLARVLPRAKVPFHTTVQDYTDVGGSAWRFGTARSKRLAGWADLLYLNATTRDATSHPMIADLRARTGRDAAQMLHAGLEETDFEHLARKLNGCAGPEGIRIAYAGSIMVEEVFALFVQALNKLRSRLSAPLVLELFSSHVYRARPWFDSAWMKERGNLPEPELSQALKECTWGFSPMSLTDVDPRYNHFSFPTKFISYLAAGLPVITLGHPESSVIKMAEAYRVGVCIKSGAEEVLHRELLGALSLRDPWASFGAEIQRCGRSEFDASRMRKTLYECFFTCAGKR